MRISEQRTRPSRGEQIFWLTPLPLQPSESAQDQRYRAAVMFQCQIEFRDIRAELNHAKEAYYTAWLPEGGEDLVIDWSIPAVEHFSLERVETEPRSSVLPYEGKIRITRKRMDEIQTDLIDSVVRRESLQLYYNPALKWYSKFGEEQHEFMNRVKDEITNQLQPQLKELARRLKLQLEQLRELPLPEDIPEETGEESQVARRRMIASLLGRTDDIIMGNPEALMVPLLTVRGEETTPDEFKRIQEELNRIEQEIFKELRTLRAEHQSKVEDCQDYAVRLQPTDVKIIRRAMLWVPV